jgi:hypothetical protein
MTLTDLKEKRSEMAGRVFMEYMRVDYRNQHEALVASCTGWSVRAERRASGERGKYSAIEKAQYSREQLRSHLGRLRSRGDSRRQPALLGRRQCRDELTPVVKGRSPYATW